MFCLTDSPSNSIMEGTLKPNYLQSPGLTTWALTSFHNHLSHLKQTHFLKTEIHLWILCFLDQMACTIFYILLSGHLLNFYIQDITGKKMVWFLIAKMSFDNRFQGTTSERMPVKRNTLCEKRPIIKERNGQIDEQCWHSGRYEVQNWEQC